MKALCVGHCSYDIMCPVEAFPQEDHKYRIEERIDSGGGSAANAAYLLGKWGVETYMAGVIGADDLGTKIKKELESVQVKTDNIETIFDSPTSISFILVNKSNGSRTIFSPSTKTSGQARKYDYLMEPNLILLDGYEYTASREAINKNPNAISVIDAEYGTPEVLELCKYVKYIVCSKDFAESMAKTKIDYNNPKTLVAMYQNLKNRFPNKEIVVTLSEKGALYSVGDEIKIMPGLNKQVKDTTAAGDIFHGAFAYGLLNNFPIEKCVSYANIAAGLSVDKIGARNSMPTLNEVISVYNEKNNQTQVSAPQAESPQATAPQVQPEAAPQSTPAPVAVPTEQATPTADTNAVATPSETPQAPAETAVPTQNDVAAPNPTDVAPTPEPIPAEPVEQSAPADNTNNAATTAIPDQLPEIK